MPPQFIYFSGNPFPVYFIFYLLSFPCCVLFTRLYYCKKYHMKNMVAIFVIILSINLIYLTLIIGNYVISKVALHGIHYVRIVGFVPLVYVAIAKVAKLDVNKTLDVVTPAVTIGNMVSHLGCIFQGCCGGYNIDTYPEWLQWMGIYSNYETRVMFPTQVFECFFYGLIAVIIALWAKRKNYQTEGKAFPIYLILFGVSRFCMEFLRLNDKIAGPLSEFSFWCIGWIVQGSVWLLIKYLWKKRKNSKVTDSVSSENTEEISSATSDNISSETSDTPLVEASATPAVTTETASTENKN